MSVQEAYFAAKLLCEGHQTNSSNNNLHNTIDAGGEQTGRFAGETDVLEDLWSIVVNRIGA